MAVVNNKKKAWLDQVKDDARRLTLRRMDESVDGHAVKEHEVNTREGVTEGTPVRQAALVNPSEPDLENFPGDSESTLSGTSPSVDKQANAPSNQGDSDEKKASRPKPAPAKTEGDKVNG